MKKITNLMLVAIIAMVAVVTSVSAESVECSNSSKVASIDGTTCYDSLNEAITNAGNGKTIKLEKEIDLSTQDNSKIYIIVSNAGNLILDLNGHKITSAQSGQATLRVEGGGTLTIKDSSTGGSIEHTGDVVAVLVKKGKVILDGVTITTTGDSGSTNNFGAIQVGSKNQSDQAELVVKESTTITASSTGIALFGTSSKVTIDGGTITSESFAVSGNGAAGNGNTIITINNGTLTSNGTAAIYHPQTGNLNINGGTISGKTGIALKAGKLTITNGTITGNGTFETASVRTGGINSTGAGIQVESNSDYEGDIELNVTGGTIESTDNSAIQEYPNEASETSLRSISISGNTTLKSNAEKDVLSFSEKFTQQNFIEVGTKLEGKTEGMEIYYEEGATLNSEGVVVKPTANTPSSSPSAADYSELDKKLAEAKKVVKSKYTTESIKALEAAIKAAEGVSRNLNSYNQLIIDNLVKYLNTAMANLKINNKVPAPNTLDNTLSYVGLALSSLGITLISVKKLKNN